MLIDSRKRRERVTIKLKEITGFGELLEKYRDRARLSQEEFARRMREKGYPNFGQRMYSHLIYNEAARIYPSFFDVASEILGLSIAEQQSLFSAWLALGRPSPKDTDT